MHFGFFSVPLPFLRLPANTHTKARTRGLSARAQPDSSSQRQRWVRAVSGAHLFPKMKLKRRMMPGAKSHPPGYAARGRAGGCEHVRVSLSKAVAADAASEPCMLAKCVPSRSLKNGGHEGGKRGKVQEEVRD